MAHNLAHLGPATESMWRDLGAVTLDPALNATICQGVDDELATHDLADIVRTRDRLLLELLVQKKSARLP